MEKIFDRLSVMRTLKNGIEKGYWTLEDLDKPSPMWKEVVNSCNGHPLYIKGYQGVKFENLARLKEPIPPPVEEKVELTNPKDLPTHF
tara:strand:+ start:611 stop:874 length:264 start_codon:yes stop_codon:yes gene_type:complete